MCSNFTSQANMQGSNNDAFADIYVNPSASGTLGVYVLAAGDSAPDLFALGPTNPPVPTRCCAICNGEDHEGVAHTLSLDLAQTNTLSSCASFSLHFWNFGTLQGWYCKFHDLTTSTPPDPIDPNEPVYHYLPMP